MKWSALAIVLSICHSSTRAAAGSGSTATEIIARAALLTFR